MGAAITTILIILIVIFSAIGYFEPKLDDTKEGSFLWYNWRGKRRYKKL